MAWSPTYCTAAELASWLGVDEDSEMALAVESASRSLDRACHRQFGAVESTEERWYPAEFHDGAWYVSIDDLMTDASMVVESDDGTEITDYVLTPRNAPAVGKPWTGIEIHQSCSLRNGVKVTARYGWTTVPNAIKLATMIQAARLYDRRENAAGPLTVKEIDDVRYGWAATVATQELDADVIATITPYRRLWAAA